MVKLTRRDFINLMLGCGVGLALGVFGLRYLLHESIPESAPTDVERFVKKARYYIKLGGGEVQCQVCFRRCVIPEGERGFCTNRENIGGKLYSLVYGKPCAIQIDPIEKEPMLHMLPGGSIFCIGTAGCNFGCIFCQNWHMSTKTIEETGYSDLPPERAVEWALINSVDGISFTYNEPTVLYEYVYDTAVLAQKRGLKTLIHTNASMNPEPLKDLLKHLDAVTVDLKGFTSKFYETTSSSEFDKVLETLKFIRAEGVWFELVNLVIPTLNDDSNTIREMCIWIKDYLGEEVPLSFSRFFPAYKLTNLPPTPVETLEEARKIAVDVGLSFVCIGNVPGHEANSTFCPQCGKKLIHRVHFKVLENNVADGKCKFCGYTVPGIWG